MKNELLGTKETQSCPAALTTRAKREGVSNDKKDKPRQLWESDRFIVAAGKAQAPTDAKEATRGHRSKGNPIRKNGGQLGQPHWSTRQARSREEPGAGQTARRDL